MKTYPLKILTPEKRIYDSHVLSVTVTGADGQLTVLAGHAPMVAALMEGPIIIRTAKETLEGIAGDGILQVDRDASAVMVHVFRWADDETETPPEKDVSAEDTQL